MVVADLQGHLSEWPPFMNRLFGLSREDFQPAGSLRDRVQSATLALLGVLALICQALFLGALAALAVEWIFPGVSFANWLLFFTLVFLILIIFVFHSLATAPSPTDDSSQNYRARPDG